MKGWMDGGWMKERTSERTNEWIQIEPRTRGNRDPTLATLGATLPRKTQVFTPASVFTREFTRFQTVTLPNCLMMGG